MHDAELPSLFEDRAIAATSIITRRAIALAVMSAVEPGQGPHHEHVAEDEAEARSDLDGDQED